MNINYGLGVKKKCLMYQNQKNCEKKRRQTRKVTEYGKKKNKKVQSEISHVKRLFDYCKNQKCRKKNL